MACARNIKALLVIALALSGAAIWLSGIAASNAACNTDEVPEGVRTMLFIQSGIATHSSCAHTLGWNWFVVFFNFATVIVAACTLCSSKLACLRLGALALLTIAVCWVAPLGHTWLLMMYNVDSTQYPTTDRAAAAAFVGALISSFANIVLTFFLGADPSTGCGALGVTATCCQKAPATGSPVAAVTRPHIPINATAFAVKSEQAAATMV